MLAETGDLYAWGDNRRGQLGLGNFISQAVPTKLTAINGEPVRFSKIATGLYTTLAVADTMALFEVEEFIPPPCREVSAGGVVIRLQEETSTQAPTRVPTKLGDELGFIPCIANVLTSAPTTKAPIKLLETKSPTAPISLSELLYSTAAPTIATNAPEFVYVGPFKGKGAVMNFTADPDFEGFITAAPTHEARRRARGAGMSSKAKPVVTANRSGDGSHLRRPLEYTGDDPLYLPSENWRVPAPGARKHTRTGRRQLLQSKAGKAATNQTKSPVKVENVTLSPTKFPTPSAINFVYVWGANEFGQLGIGSHVQQVTRPQPVSFMNHHKVIDLAVGPYSTGQQVMATCLCFERLVWHKDPAQRVQVYLFKNVAPANAATSFASELMYG
jgi:hypothetical protein